MPMKSINLILYKYQIITACLNSLHKVLVKYWIKAVGAHIGIGRTRKQTRQRNIAGYTLHSSLSCRGSSDFGC